MAQPRLRLDAAGVEHVAHAHGDDPVEFLRLGAHPSTSVTGYAYMGRWSITRSHPRTIR